MKSPADSELYGLTPISQPFPHAPGYLPPDWFAARRWIFPGLASVIALLAIAFAPSQLAAQQGYPASPLGYGSQYAQPSPQYAQPQYAQPQYRQPQYAPQQPYTQQPYTQQPYPQEPYSDRQYEASPYPPQQEDYGQPAAAPVQPLSAQDLEELVAPVALYPDALLAQILAASTYPGQVAVADRWLTQMRARGYGEPDQIAAGAQAQTGWDPSVKSLTAFPDVLDMLNHNLEWTTALGNAYYNQPQDVMQTVQVLRERAEQAGNLQSTPQEQVTDNQGYIQLAPPNPEVVYVPTYDPWTVYGPPIAPYPGFSFIGALGEFFFGAPIHYGLCFGVAAFEPFGVLAWGLDWMAHAIFFDHAHYYSHSATVADWGLPHGGPRAYGGGWGGSRTRDGTYGASRAWNGQSAGNRQQAGGRQDYNQRGYDQHSYDRGSGTYGSRGSQQPGYGYTHPALPGQNYERSQPQQYARVAPQQSYGYRPQTYPNRLQAYAGQSYASRPQTYPNPAYGYSNRAYSGNAYSGQAYASRPGYGYSNSSPSYRAPQSNSPRAFTGRSIGGNGNAIARNEHSGGFHPFGGERGPSGFSSGRAPKNSYSAPKSYGGGHRR